MCATWPVNFIMLGMIILITSGLEYQLWSSKITKLLIVQALSSITESYLILQDQVSRTYKTTVKTIALYCEMTPESRNSEVRMDVHW
jgi:hypothetical protein